MAIKERLRRTTGSEQRSLEFGQEFVNLLDRLETWHETSPTTQNYTYVDKSLLPKDMSIAIWDDSCMQSVNTQAGQYIQQLKFDTEDSSNKVRFLWGTIKNRDSKLQVRDATTEDLKAFNRLIPMPESESLS